MDAHNMTYTSILLAGPLLGGLFMRRLRQPVLVGYIVAGVLLGPHVLGLASSTETVEWLAELGIIMLMFMIGLELDMHAFRERLAQSLTVVGVQVGMSIATIAGIAYIFPALTEHGFGFAVLIGSAIALSSTAVAITVLKDLRQAHTDAGTTATSILIAQDLAVVPILILIQLFSGEHVTTSHLIHASISIGVVALTLWGIIYLSHHKRLLRRMGSIFSHGVDQPALAALACIFIAASISGAAGLSAAYGAFALGLILRNLGDVGEAYGKAIEPLHDLLLMIFFVSVGFILDLPTLWNHTALIAALLTVVVLLKTIGNTLVLSITPLSWRGRLLAGAAVSQIGEFSFVLFGTGLSSALITHEQYQIGLAVIALSLVTSPLWVSIVKRMTHTALPRSVAVGQRQSVTALRELVYEVRSTRTQDKHARTD